jgi:hypothetical protein
MNKTYQIIKSENMYKIAVNNKIVNFKGFDNMDAAFNFMKRMYPQWILTKMVY